MFDEKAYMREYRKKNIDRIRELKRRAYWKNIEASREANRKNYEKHAESRKAKVKDYISKNRAAHSQYVKKWDMSNPEKKRALGINRRAKIAATGGKLSSDHIKAIVVRQKGKCAACGQKTKLAMDHIMPLALGGSGHHHNFQGLCRSCNSKKHARHPIDFNQSLGRLL